MRFKLVSGGCFRRPTRYGFRPLSERGPGQSRPVRPWDCIASASAACNVGRYGPDSPSNPNSQTDPLNPNNPASPLNPMNPANPMSPMNPDHI
jgi:hypothetical protein